MDLSKLPKMSDTRRAEESRRADAASSPPPEPAQPADASPQAVDHGQVIAVEVGPSGWISLIVGGVLLLLTPRFLQWVSHAALGTSFTWTFSAADGSPLAYTRTIFFWGDLALTAMALAMIVDGLVLLLAATSRTALRAALVLIAAATLLNTGFVAVMMAEGYGLQLMSLVAALVGGFMTYQQWQLLSGSSRRYLVVER